MQLPDRRDAHFTTLPQLQQGALFHLCCFQAGCRPGIIRDTPHPARQPESMRSVIHRPTARCNCCQLPLRWCLCFAAEVINTPLQTDLLTHPRERMRPTSTGNLIHRLFAGSQQHLWSEPHVPTPETVCRPGREVWILHPKGTPPPRHADPGQIQLLIPDGSWSETNVMSRAVSSWGRKVSLPLQGESRYWLRAKQDNERFSTAEALMYLLRLLGLDAACSQLDRQFELHVYACLRARGKVSQAAEFLAVSHLQTSMPDILAQLQARRSRAVEGMPQ
jgi:DTW domain-containing protein YfiP